MRIVIDNWCEASPLIVSSFYVQNSLHIVGFIFGFWYLFQFNFQFANFIYLYEWNDPGLCVSFTLLLLLLRNICCNLEIICNPTNHLEQYILLLLVHHNRRWNHSPSRKILFGRGHGIKSTFVVSNGAVAIDVVVAVAVAAAVGVALLCCWWYLAAKLLFSLHSVAPCTALAVAGGGPRMHLDKEMIEFWLHWLRCARRCSREGHDSSSAAFRAAFQVENFNVSTAVKIHCLVSGLLAACCLRPSHPGCSSVWSHSIQT